MSADMLKDIQLLAKGYQNEKLTDEEKKDIKSLLKNSGKKNEKLDDYGRPRTIRKIRNTVKDSTKADGVRELTGRYIPINYYEEFEELINSIYEVENSICLVKRDTVMFYKECQYPIPGRDIEYRLFNVEELNSAIKLNNDFFKDEHINEMFRAGKACMFELCTNEVVPKDMIIMAYIAIYEDKNGNIKYRIHENKPSSNVAWSNRGENNRFNKIDALINSIIKSVNMK